nr:8-oxo-dGTP diphosphatase [Paenibacillus sp. NFR01]
MNMAENIKLYTVCLIIGKDGLLLLDRQHGDFRGFIAPGGRVEFRESPIQCAIREVKEETGLDVSHLQFKGIAEYMNPGDERYMIFNYITYEYSGELKTESREGKPSWIPLSELEHIPMQANFRRRIPLLLGEGCFETHMDRYEDGMAEEHVILC